MFRSDSGALLIWRTSAPGPIRGCSVKRARVVAVCHCVNGTDGQYRVDPIPLAGTRRIFAATRVADQARFLVKRPRPGCPPAEEAAVLRHEFAVLSQLKGTSVAEASEFIEDPIAALVLTIAPGRSVDALIVESLPDALHWVSYAVEMVRALAAVHARGVLHRDVKPHHFFIDPATGQARLIDFGLATPLARERRLPVEADEI